MTKRQLEKVVDNVFKRWIRDAYWLGWAACQAQYMGPVNLRIKDKEVKARFKKTYGFDL